MHRQTILLATLCGLLLAAPALGQVALPSIERNAPEWDSHLAATARYQKDAGIGAGGRFETLQFEALAWAEGPLTDNIQFNLLASYAHTHFDFTCGSPGACFGANPWQDVHRLDLAPGASLLLTPAIRLRVNFPIRWNAEAESNESAITAGAVVQLQWRMSSTFIVGLGVGARSELGEETSVYPALSLDWKMAPEFRLQTRGGPYRGGELALIWSPSDVFQGVLSAGYQRQRFRLAGSSGADSNGFAESTSIPLLVAIELRFSSRLKIVAEGGMAVSGELSVENAQGIPLEKSDFDSAGLLRGYATFSF